MKDESKKSNRAHHQDLVERLAIEINQYHQSIEQADPVDITAFHDFSATSDTGYMIVTIGADYPAVMELLSVITQLRRPHDCLVH